MRNINKKIGNTTEQQVLTFLQSNGLWAHLLVDNKNGQPFDILALRGESVWALDVKHLTNDNKRFVFSRMEVNQFTSMGDLSQKFMNSVCGFVVVCDNDMRFISYQDCLRLVAQGEKSCLFSDMPTFKECLEYVYRNR